MSLPQAPRQCQRKQGGCLEPQGWRRSLTEEGRGGILRESWQSMKRMDRSFQGTVRAGTGEIAAGRARRKWENWYSPMGNKIPVSQKEEQAGKQVGAWEMSCMLREDEWLSCIQPISLTDGANWSAAPLTKHATTWWEITCVLLGLKDFQWSWQWALLLTTELKRKPAVTRMPC